MELNHNIELYHCIDKCHNGESDNGEKRGVELHVIEEVVPGCIVIRNRKWYYRLLSGGKCDTGKSDNTSRALMDDYKIEDINGHIVVCFVPETIDGIPFVRGDGSLRHIYSYFDSCDELNSYMRLFDATSCSFFRDCIWRITTEASFWNRCDMCGCGGNNWYIEGWYNWSMY